MKILAIDLGKYKSVACNYVTATGTARFATVVTHANEFDRLLSQESPDLVVIETCSIAGWTGLIRTGTAPPIWVRTASNNLSSASNDEYRTATSHQLDHEKSRKP